MSSTRLCACGSLSFALICLLLLVVSPPPEQDSFVLLPAYVMALRKTPQPSAAPTSVFGDDGDDGEGPLPGSGYPTPYPALDTNHSSQPPFKTTSPDKPKKGTHASLHFLPADMSKLLVFASYPGSGNTWMRHLLEVGSGVYSGSVYADPSLFGDFPAENVADATTIAVKDHNPCDECVRNPAGLLTTHRNRHYYAHVCPFCHRIQFARDTFDYSVQPAMSTDEGLVLLLIRNPFDSILAYFNLWKSHWNHTGLAKESDLESPLFARYFKARLREWVRHTDRYSRFALHTLYFERLVHNTSTELVRLFAFLKRRRPDDLAAMDPVQAAARTLADLRGNEKREKKKPVYDPYTAPRKGGTTLRRVGCHALRHVWRADIWGACDHGG